MDDPRRSIPSIDRLLASDAFATLLQTTPRTRVMALLQDVQQHVRTVMASGEMQEAPHGDAWYATAVRTALLRSERASLQPVINATGVVLHTNLGRAPLAPDALAAIARAAAGYTNLEYDIEHGERGSRYRHCAALLCELTGAEDALVVNNNAAALVLAASTLAADRDVLVSRGELVEIGGGFRVPEVLARSGARLHEVGATNRTRIEDYERALGGTVGAVLKVHRSNFRMSGFVEETDVESLATLARRAGVPLLYDLGSGLLVDPSLLGLPPEPIARAALAQGADVVAISGDKLLGGPQAGILLGRASLIAAMRRNPLCRAVRVDKLTLAALEATLALYRDPLTAIERIPVLRMIAMTPQDLRARADRLAATLAADAIGVDVVEADGAVGGGAFPETRLPGFALALAGIAGAARLDELLRAGTPPIVGRIREDRLLLDPRTIPVESDALVAAGVRTAWAA